ncbi:MAG: hypothetical protein ABIS18_00035 [Actinomycetota bacterium]
MSDFQPVQFEPKDATQQEWTLYHAYRTIRHMELNPDDPLTPDDLVETSMKRDDPFSERKQFAIMADGQMISGFGAGVMKPHAPGYESNKDFIWGGADVIKDYRRRGIGTIWLRNLSELMHSWDKTLMTTWVEEDDGRAFLNTVGAAEKSVFAENRLNFQKIDWEMIERWIQDGKDRSPDATIELFEDRLPDEFLEEYTPILSELLMTMPFDDMEHGDIVVTPETAREHQARSDAVGTKIHTLVVRSPQGKLLGMTDVAWNPSKPTFVDQRFTGVDPVARGAGLGKLLKAYMLNFLRTKYEGIEWVVTGNAKSNDSMLAINHALGFKEHRPHSVYQISRDDVDTYLAKS